MKYIVTIKAEGKPKGGENLVGIAPEDTFHVYDVGGHACECCKDGGHT